MSSKELLEKYNLAFTTHITLEKDMWLFLEAAKNREEAATQVLQKGGLIDKIHAAQDDANKAWKQYSNALRMEHDEEEKALAKIEKDTNL